jgi:hypothetical protein
MWRFKKDFEDAEIVISGMNLVITSKNLTDARAEMIVKKFPQFAHNLENVNPEFKGGVESGEELATNENEVDRLTGKPVDHLAGVSVSEDSSPVVRKMAEKAEAANTGNDEAVSELDQELAELEAAQNETQEDEPESKTGKGKNKGRK